MSYQCVMDWCENEAIFDTNVCEECLSGLKTESGNNFGEAKLFGCPICGVTLNMKEYLAHGLGGDCLENK